MENITSLETSELKELYEKYSPYFQEIRRRILLTLGVFAVAMLVGFIFYERIIKFIIEILSLKGVNIVFTSPFQFINLAITCSFATGLVFVFPLIIYQILSFLKPALRSKEFQMVMNFLPFSLALFIAGFLFGIFVMKWQIQIFLSHSISLGIGNVLDISHLLSTVVITSVLMGVAFQFPVVVSMLLNIGVIKHHQISKQRLWVYLGSFIFAILLPADSILADIVLSLPIIFMFELTLVWNRMTGGHKK